MKEARQNWPQKKELLPLAHTDCTRENGCTTALNHDVSLFLQYAMKSAYCSYYTSEVRCCQGKLQRQGISSLPSISPISPDFGETWNQRGESGQKATGFSGIIHVSKSDVDGNRQAQCVNQEMTLAPFDMLMDVKSRNAG